MVAHKTLVSAPVPIGIGIRGLGLGLDKKYETQSTLLGAFPLALVDMFYLV